MDAGTQTTNTFALVWFFTVVEPVERAIFWLKAVQSSNE